MHTETRRHVSLNINTVRDLICLHQKKKCYGKRIQRATSNFNLRGNFKQDTGESRGEVDA